MIIGQPTDNITKSAAYSLPDFQSAAPSSGANEGAASAPALLDIVSLSANAGPAANDGQPGNGDLGSLKPELYTAPTGRDEQPVGQVAAGATAPVEEAKVGDADEDESDFGTDDLKFLAMGTLGLDPSPDQPDCDSGYYKVGQYLKAAGTVGGFVALFI